MNLYEAYDKLSKLNLQESIEPDPVNEILHAYGDVEFEYDGFSRDWFEDHFDPGSLYGHYQTGGENYWNGFTYKVDAVTVFEDLRDYIIPKYLDKVFETDVIKQYKNLTATAEKEDTDEAWEALDLFTAKNLDALVEAFNEQLIEHYAEEAEDWAVDYLEPYDPRDDYYED